MKLVAFIGNTLRGKVSRENFDESIASRQNSSDTSTIKVLYNTVTLICKVYACLILLGISTVTTYL